jgi:hypothetical protein
MELTDLPDRYKSTEEEEKLFTQDAIEGKEYAAHGTAKRKLIVVGLSLFIIVVVAFGVTPVRLALQLLISNSKSDSQIPYVQGDSLVYHEGGQKRSVSLQVSGGTTIATRFPGGLAAADSSSMTVSFVASNGSTSEVKVTEQFGEGDYIASLSPHPSGVLAVVKQSRRAAGIDQSSRTVLVEPGRAGVTVIFDDAAGQVSPDGQTAVTYNKMGVFKLISNTSSSDIVERLNVTSWSYDFQNSALVVADDASVSVYRGGSEKSFKPAVLHKVISVQTCVHLQRRRKGNQADGRRTSGSADRSS